MGSTGTWQLPYPEEADPADVPVDMKELCDRLEVVLSQLKSGGAIPGEIRAWGGSALPVQGTYGHWVWADGAAYASATYPVASGNIAGAWKTHNGKTDPGAGQFRVPDLRGCVLTGLDAMPGGARANRIARAAAITVAGVAGEEFHALASAEMPAHGHVVNDPTHGHGLYDPGHAHGVADPGHHHDVVAGSGGYNHDTPGMTDQSGYYRYATQPAGTGIGIYGAGTGMSVYGSGTGISLQSAGGGGAHENLSPSTFIPYICKLDD